MEVRHSVGDVVFGVLPIIDPTQNGKEFVRGVITKIVYVSNHLYYKVEYNNTSVLVDSENIVDTMQDLHNIFNNNKG